MNVNGYISIAESIGHRPPQAKPLSPTDHGPSASTSLSVMERLISENQAEKKRLEESQPKQLRPAYSIMS